MKILTLRFKNLNSLKVNGKLILPLSRLPATGCLPSPARPVREKPRCWMPSASRCITKRHGSRALPSHKMT